MNRTYCGLRKTPTHVFFFLCVVCDQGYYLVGGACSQCAVDSYKDTPGSTSSCTSCGTGYTTLNQGATTQTACGKIFIVELAHLKYNRLSSNC